MKRRLLRVLAVVGALAAGLGGYVATQQSPAKSPTRTWRRGLKQARPALSLLSPPGAGYDSTNIALTTGSGGAVTVTRASTQSCEDGSAIRTVSANQPCVAGGALLVEPSGTNVLLRSAELDNAAWSSTGTPVVTANTWDFGSGVIGDTLTDDDAASSESRDQAVTTGTTGAWMASCYVQAGTLTDARLSVFVTGGTGTSTCQLTGLSATTSRASCPATVGGAVTAVSIRLLPGLLPADVGSIKVGGCQLETGSVATSYIPTGAATASRAAQTTTVAKPASLSTTEGCAKVCVTPAWTGPPGASALILLANSGFTFRPLYIDSVGQNVAVYDGTTFVLRSTTFTAGVRRCYRSSWSATRNLLAIEDLADGTRTTGAFAGFPAADATLAIGGSYAATLPFTGKLASIVLGISPDACR